jgi:hypothetical protein
VEDSRSVKTTAPIAAVRKDSPSFETTASMAVEGESGLVKTAALDSVKTTALWANRTWSEGLQEIPRKRKRKRDPEYITKRTNVHDEHVDMHEFEFEFAEGEDRSKISNLMIQCHKATLLKYEDLNKAQLEKLLNEEFFDDNAKASQSSTMQILHLAWHMNLFNEENKETKLTKSTLEKAFKIAFPDSTTLCNNITKHKLVECIIVHLKAFQETKNRLDKKGKKRKKKAKMAQRKKEECEHE